MYRVRFNTWSELHGGPVLAEDTFNADNASVVPGVGALELTTVGPCGHTLLKAIPPGAWFECDRVETALSYRTLKP